jgi:hypothetical protein
LIVEALEDAKRDPRERRDSVIKELKNSRQKRNVRAALSESSMIAM